MCVWHYLDYGSNSQVPGSLETWKPTAIHLLLHQEGGCLFHILCSDVSSKCIHCKRFHQQSLHLILQLSWGLLPSNLIGFLHCWCTGSIDSYLPLLSMLMYHRPWQMHQIEMLIRCSWTAGRMQTKSCSLVYAGA